jgi:D-methionine transport system permease protein
MNGWFSNVNWADIAAATGGTLVMLAASLALTIVLGLPLGVLLYVTGKRQIGENRVFHGILGVVINVLRSVPFIILLIVMIPLTVALVGTSLGVVGAILPLVVGAAPFYARLVEGALREVDRTTIEATQAMGATPLQIVTGTLIPEALPGLISGATVTAVALVSFTAMAGVVGAGGLGDLAIRFGYQRFQTDVMIVTVALLVLLVQAIQLAGDRLAAAFTRR